MGSSIRRFDDPVTVVIDGEEFSVIELSDAGRLLLTKWPLDTARRRKAMEEVAGALRGQGTADAARRAFIDASLEHWLLRVG